MVASWGLAAPAVASAAQSFSVSSPSGFPAGGDSSYTTTMSFDSAAGAPSRAIITLAPGVLASLAANPSCVKSVQHTSDCQIGTGSAMLMGGLPASLTAYLVPPNDPATAVAGIDLVSSASTTHAEVQLKQTTTGNVSSVLNIDFSTAGPLASVITGSSLTVNGTLDGRPFNRMPSNCSPGPSSLTVQYSGGTSETTQASPDFAITGCASLPYAPRLDAVLTKDRADDGVKVVTTVSQAADEAASASNSLRLPWPAVGPNFSALSLQCLTAPCGKAVGMVTAVSPLLPTALVGQAYLTGTPLGPTLTLLFPPPNALKLVGSVVLSTSTVTFNSVPDVPQTSLAVTLLGGSDALEITTCQPPAGMAAGDFTGQNGHVVKVSEHVAVSGCSPSRPTPTISRASLSGLRRGEPVLGFTLAKAPAGAKLRSFTLTPPRGLRFNPHGLARGLTVRGARSIALHGNRLTVTLKRAADTITVRLGGPLLVASRHRTRPRRLVVAVTDTAGHSTRLRARL